MMPPICREAGGFAIGLWLSITSRYFSPEPVLNSTTLSSAEKKPLARNLRYATNDVAPSGAANIPSTLAQWRNASIISASVAVRAMPELFFRISRMR